MFGYWFHRALYENFPPMFFLSGLLLALSSVMVNNGLTSSLMALGGMALMIGAFSAIGARNVNRKQAFKMKQLVSFTRK